MSGKNLVIISLMALVIQSCASPHVVESKQVSDNQLSCSEIIAQIEEADQFERDARKERKVTGTNVAAAVFFWPALIGTYANTEEAIDAARERKQHLTKLHSEKCS